jgi:hypothetical protein
MNTWTQKSEEQAIQAPDQLRAQVGQTAKVYRPAITGRGPLLQSLVGPGGIEGGLGLLLVGNAKDREDSLSL